MGEVAIRLLGEFGVEIDGRTVRAADFARRCGAELVQLLALSPNRRLHRDQVMDALWPDSEPKSATNMLYKASSYARAALGTKRAITVRNEQVCLLPDDLVEIDAVVVERADAANPRSVRRAIDAYRGELLPEALYADWVEVHRSRLRLRVSELLAVAQDWTALFRFDPLNERAVVELMKRDLAAGERVNVMRRFDDFALRLHRELGLEPGPDAVRLRHRAEQKGPAANGV